MNQPKTYLISVAVAHYADARFSRLKNVENDATGFEKILTSQYKVVSFQLLYNSEATIERFSQCMNELSSQINDGDSLLFSFNGHGMNHLGKFYFQLHDSDFEKDYTWYAFSRLEDEIRSMAALKHAVFFINACRSGDLFESLHRHSQLAMPDNARILFTAGSAGQDVPEYSSLYPDNSPFMGCVIEVLKKNKQVDLSIHTIIYRVKRDISELNIGAQPRNAYLTGHEGADFHLRLKHDAIYYWQKAQNEDNNWKMEADNPIDGIRKIIQAYQDYRDSFERGENFEYAMQRISALEAELQAWIDCNLKLVLALNFFIQTNDKIRDAKWINHANSLVEKYQKNINAFNIETELKAIYDKRNSAEAIESLDLFIDKYQIGEYVLKAKEQKDILEREMEEDHEWKNINANRNRSVETRLSLYHGFIRRFPYQWFVNIMRQTYGGMHQRSISYENQGAFLRLLRQLQTWKKLFQEITH